MTTLTPEQRQQYAEQGFLLVPGLIPPGVAEQAAAALWRHLNADPADPASWERVSNAHQSFDDPALLACYTPDLLAAAAQLAGDDPATFSAPNRAYAINVFPTPGDWNWPHPHLDHSIREHGHHVFPRAFRIAGMAFLSDVPPHGAGTVVWPGSHRKLEALARSDPARYELMWTLNQDLDRVEDLGKPLETTPRRGDVLFYHYLCAHAGSKNASDQPRLALNMKW